jgi:hypothetical protein
MLFFLLLSCIHKGKKNFTEQLHVRHCVMKNLLDVEEVRIHKVFSCWLKFFVPLFLVSLYWIVALENRSNRALFNFSLTSDVHWSKSSARTVVIEHNLSNGVVVELELVVLVASAANVTASVGSYSSIELCLFRSRKYSCIISMYT